MSFNFQSVRATLQSFDFGTLFIEHLGWAHPPQAERKWRSLPVKTDVYKRRAIAELGGVLVFEVSSPGGRIPDAAHRKEVFNEVVKQFHEHLLIFVDDERTQSLWYWVKREGKSEFPRSQIYVKGQPGDLLLGKLDAIHFDISELDEKGSAPVVEVANRLRRALDVEKVTKVFFKEFQKLHERFIESIQHVSNKEQQRWYASVLLNRLMFVYFLQKRGFVLDDQEYLQNKLNESKSRGKDQFFSEFLQPLFFEGFAKPEKRRDPEVARRIGRVRYLNGGLFLPHQVEEKNPKLDVPDEAFEETFALFRKYDWHLDDTPGADDRHINPDVLGYIFEKYINQKDFGAYYTRPEITTYLCERTIHRVIRDRVNGEPLPPEAAGLGIAVTQFATFESLILNLDDRVCRELFDHILPRIRVLDPACGSGAFLVASMKTLIGVYAAVIGRIKIGGDTQLKKRVAELEEKHRSLGYFIRREIIANNLFGVDLMEEATEIAKLRLFLALVAAAETEDQLEPLPNIDFNVLPGNSLVGLLEVKDEELGRPGQKTLPGLSPADEYRHALAEKDRLEDLYRSTSEYTPDLATMRRDIDKRRDAAAKRLDGILLGRFAELNIKFEQATWDVKKGVEGKPIRKKLVLSDIRALSPFHWTYEFNKVFKNEGGFDVIVMNPPWDAFKPDDKEFFLDYSDVISKKKMTIKEFEKEKTKLLEESDLRKEFCDYLSRFPHVSSYCRGALQYAHQSSVVNGKRVGTDTNLYKLFVEQCFNLLRTGGQAGIIVPAGLYNDQGAKALREMLFDSGDVRALFGLSNERFLFEEVDHRVKFCIFVFGKGGTTTQFQAAFRINPREAVAAEQLDVFLRNERLHLTLTPALVRKLSPTTVSLMEFRSPTDIEIAEKMMRFPALEQCSDIGWKLVLCNELHMTNDSDLFKTEPGPRRLPLYEGKLIHQYEHLVAEPKYWIEEKEGRQRMLGKQRDEEQTLNYESYRLAFREIARNTDTRTMIATIVPRRVFCNHKLCVEKVGTLDPWARLYLLSLFNSFSLDYLLRQRVNSSLSFFFIYNLPIPRLLSSDIGLRSIALRAAKLVCTGPEFDDLAREVGLRDHRDGATDFAARAELRAEIDGLVAHLYGLTEAEFVHILATFPVVPDPQKVAAHNAYRDVAAGVVS